jgi:hypothetical protein
VAVAASVDAATMHDRSRSLIADGDNNGTCAISGIALRVAIRPAAAQPV